MKLWLRSFTFLLFMTVLCGVAYPLLVTGIAQALFPDQASGSIITINGKQYGTELMAQQFTGHQHLWGRIMLPDTASFSGKDGKALLYGKASNLSPAGADFAKLVAERVQLIRAAHPDKADVPVPVDLVTVSGSGMDPEISPAAAGYQIGRIARQRGLSEQRVKDIIARFTTGRFLGIFGESRVNVLKVNLALEGIL